MKISLVILRNKTLEIYLDEELRGTAHQEILGRNPSFPRPISSLTEFEEALALMLYQGAKRYALKRLAMRAFSSYEMRERLLDRLVPEGISQRVIEECQQLGYINDQEWTESFLRSRSQSSYGPYRLASKLRHKGVPLEQIEEILEPLKNAETQQEAIAALIHRRYYSFDLKDPKQRGKVIQSLQRRGFDLFSILEVISSDLRNN
jgi:regulatory protein